MREEDMVLVSIDDHLIEPAGVFEAHIPDRFRDRAPKMERDENGVDRWIFEGVEVGSPGLNAVAGWPKEEWSMDPVGLAEMRPGCYDVDQRVRDMDAAGIWKSMCFPTMGGFSMRAFNESVDKELAGAVISAYNDWHIDEWCGPHPDRFIALSVVPLWDPEACAAEVRRVAAKGCRAITFPETPYALGLPSFESGHWDPLFHALCDEGVVMCLHIGLGISLIRRPEGGSLGGPGNLGGITVETIDTFIVLAQQVSAIALTDLVFGGTLRRFPDLKIALSEGGIGWLPFYLEKADRHWTNQVWTGARDGRLPSDLFRDQVLACFITDPAGVKLRHEIGIDNIAWECDYPHADSTWPTAATQLAGEFAAADCSDDDINKIGWENSCRWFGVDVSDMDRDAVSVGGLQKQGADVDVSIVSKSEWRERYALTGAED
ncbi:amidohydrolase family protein [Candidatus Poriferisocius sp.]|uniref:amidohydrolase family protein n=1 Tax=Candidatus Poriferisocius sp. TaxID=3101276 RepID=UPI003B01031C